jgi:hypothetical protein
MNQRNERMIKVIRFSCAIALCAAPHASAQLPTSPNCRPFELITPGRRAADSVLIAGRLVARTQDAVRAAWQATSEGRTARPGGFFPGERVLIYRDSQPRGSAIFDGCTLVPEQLPLPAYWQADSIAEIEILPSNTVARLLHDRRGYQHFNVTMKRPKIKSGAPPT